MTITTRSRARGAGRLAPLLFAAGALGLLLMSVGVRSYCVTQGYEVERLHQRKKALLEEGRTLTNRIGDLSAYRRVEGVATDRLGLTVPRTRADATIELPPVRLQEWLSTNLMGARRTVSQWLTRWF